MDFDDDVARMVVAWWVRSGGLMRSAYPTPHRGSHKGVPLRCAFGVLRRVSPVHGGNVRRTKGATTDSALPPAYTPILTFPRRGGRDAYLLPCLMTMHP